MRCPLCAFGRVVLYVLWTLLLVPVQWVAVALGSPLGARLPVFYHRRCLRLAGLTVAVRGQIAPGHPILFVANHSSYLDILVLGSILPLSFVAKREVGDWPFFGLLAKLQRTVFVDRRRRGHVRAQRDEMAERLRAGDDLVLFPEGTSDDGNRILPFKSALLSAAETEVKGRPVTVQPVSIAYIRLDGIPLGRALRPQLAWYGDMSLLPHLWRVFSLGEVAVEVTFHPWPTHAACAGRRALPDSCRRLVADGLAASLTGRSGQGQRAAASPGTAPPALAPAAAPPAPQP